MRDMTTICASEPFLDCRTRPTQPLKTINLALQGGGAHGAFAWGRARQIARGRSNRDRGDFRDERRGHECDCLVVWLFARRLRWRTQGARQFLASNSACRACFTPAALPPRPCPAQSCIELHAGLPHLRSYDPSDVSLPIQPAEHQTATSCTRAVGRLRSTESVYGHKSISLRYQCAHRENRGLQER